MARKSGAAGQLNFAFEPGPSDSKGAAVGKGVAKKKTKTTRKAKASKKSGVKTKGRAGGSTTKTGTDGKSSKSKKTGRGAKASKSAVKKIPKRVKRPPEHIRDDQIETKALAMAKEQKEISVSEFFAKNRHLLGFDNPRKALLTAIKEAVDNSLDACEEAHILPEIDVGIKQTADDRFAISIQDNGPGIVKQQIPNIFGRLLYGSKFHRLRMSRGQQGIGISAAGMYGLLTTGKCIRITSRTGPGSVAHYYELQINTKKNRPEVITDSVVQWEVRNGTLVEFEIEARYQKGRQSVDEYLAQTAITNPHARMCYTAPDGRQCVYERSVKDVVEVPKAVKPHPYGVELGVLLKMIKDTRFSGLSAFLCNEFSRVSSRVSQQIVDKAKLSARKRCSSLGYQEVERLYRAIGETKIMAPSTNCIVPIGQENLLKGIQQVVSADFCTACTRPPSVYRGNPFQIEAALAYGGNGYSANGDNGGKDGDDGDEQELMRVLRFANRVPLLYQQSACATFRSILQTNWRSYGLSQSRGALPTGPVTVIVHVASVWVPFTSESKEAVAHYPEIIKEIKLAIAECGRRLGKYLRGRKKQREEALKRSYIEKYLPVIGEALQEILALKDAQVSLLVKNLEHVLEHSRSVK